MFGATRRSRLEGADDLRNGPGMSIPAILLPVFVQVGLTFILLLPLAATRFGALGRREVRSSEIAVGPGGWPERPARMARAFENQFEIPLLFYVLVFLAIMTRKGDVAFVVMEWLFVVSRLIHAVIHAGFNNLRFRFAFFAFGVAVLLVMWTVFAVRILAA
jgi:hypothetical protein